MEEKVIDQDTYEEEDIYQDSDIPVPVSSPATALKKLNKEQIYMIAGAAFIIVVVAVVLLLSKFCGSGSQPQNPYDMTNSGMTSSNSMDISVNGEHNAVDPTVNVPAVEDKSIEIAVREEGRSNPFKPVMAIASKASSSLGSQLNFDIIEPPETFTEDSPAKELMNTKISGILYEQKNPSAIINISGQDYFVKRGDYINDFHVLQITRDEVVVESQNNIFRARVGQALESSGEGINRNTVYNLKGKFGGSYR